MRKTTINSESLLGFDDMFEIELSTDNSIGETGVKSLSESLKSNTTLTELNLSSEDKRKKTHKRHPSTIHSFSFLILSTGNNIGDTGVSSLSESLKSNTTLNTLNLGSEDKRKKIHRIHPSTIHSSFSHHINREHHWRKRSSIIE